MPEIILYASGLMGQKAAQSGAKRNYALLAYECAVCGNITQQLNAVLGRQHHRHTWAVANSPSWPFTRWLHTEHLGTL